MGSPNPSDPASGPEETRVEENTEEVNQGRKEKILAHASELISKAEGAQEAARLHYALAEKTTDAKEKQKELEEAMKQDKIAKAAFKAAGRLQSGVWQGGAMGVGIGAGVGTGVGTVVGSVVGGVTAIPTTLVGGLVGVGTGAAHGPWFKIGDDEKRKEECDEDETSVEVEGTKV
jgi:hypothetical protein